VESFEIGMPVNYYIRHPDLNGGADNKKLARIGLNAYLKMMLFDNFVHADLHPGNILVRRSADNELQAVLLDVGLVSQLSDTDWLHFKDLFKCIVQGDGKGGAELMVRHARDSKISPEAKGGNFWI
jgi:aarF domain-containing kinase